MTKDLTPQPQQLSLGKGFLPLRSGPLSVRVPSGPEHEACRIVITEALKTAGATFRLTNSQQPTVNTFAIEDRSGSGQRVALPALPTAGCAEQAYVLAVTPNVVAAKSASAAGLLYAAETLRQLIRLSSSEGRLPCLTISDYPQLRMRGIYIEGGQERFGRIVDKNYLLEQIRRLAEFKMNLLVIECYNLFPYASYPACADEGTLSRQDCQQIVEESRRHHVVIMPSLQTLAQAYELVWTNDAGTPYRELTAPGLMCPSNPDLYPFIKNLYRDLLNLFNTSPLIGIGCSEIEMQWQGRYCPKCRARIEAGETVRGLLLSHADKCIKAVHDLSAELGRPIRPMMWGDEFYMYGPGRDWVGLERVPKDVVMGYWKYWQDYAGIQGLLERGYDVLGISAMYNHCLYLADLSPGDPPKSWPAMEQTGIRNITEMVQEAATVRQEPPGRDFVGCATASFSKHRLRAFDSIWYGFVLNGHCAWSHPERTIASYQDDYTRAFARHYYDARTDPAADALVQAYQRLDHCKSQLELANQSLHDVVGVYDTQETGYQGNAFLGACQKCRGRINPQGEPDETLAKIRRSALQVMTEARETKDLIEIQKPAVGRLEELGDLWLAAEKIEAHAEREVLLIDAQSALARAPKQPSAQARKQMASGAKRWSAHRRRVERILDRTSHLYSKGDPCGFAALHRDVRTIEAHFKRLAESGEDKRGAAGNQRLLEEQFQTLDSQRWIILDHPRVLGGILETRAPGGWGKYCGIVTRETFDLENERPLVVEFDLTPLKMGVDSQLFASATEQGEVSYRFSFYGPSNRFGIYTQSATSLGSEWVDSGAGWHLRAMSPEVELSRAYHIRAEITRRTWRVIVYPSGQNFWELPLWDTGATPMDELNQTRLMFGDVEPEGGTAASRWGSIKIWREERGL